MKPMTTGILAELNSIDGISHISLCYFVVESDYIVFTVAAKCKEHTYWAQYTNKSEAVADYNGQYEKIFNR